MDDQNKNLILAVVLSSIVMLVWLVFFPPEQPQPASLADPETGSLTAPPAESGAAPTATSSDTPTPSASPQGAETLATAPRVPVITPSLEGSLSLMGGRIDDLLLTKFAESLDADSPRVSFLRPATELSSFYALFGWAPGGDLTFDDVPNANTLWELAEGETLTPETPVVLEWRNAKGLTFRRDISVDEDYLFTIVQSVRNDSGATARIAPEASLERVGEPVDLKGVFMLHEGAIRQKDDERDSLTYKKMRDMDDDTPWSYGTNLADVAKVNGGGWVGFTDHYWMATLVPDHDTPYQSILQYDQSANTYRSIARKDTLVVGPGETVKSETLLFAGAKEWDIIHGYQENRNIDNFDDAIDWGWFFFLTKPIFRVLHALNEMIGNMGWAIIALTLLIKAILFPLAYRSYVSMAKMKELQPEMEKIKEKAGDDRQKLQQEMMALYKKERVNPASGCLPILLQIPIFFSLYKVIFVTLDLRQAPWVGWIKDLSAPDPSSIFNLFGILPFAAPDPNSLVAFISLGILPILLGISMWLQQKLNPAPTDPTQAMIFAWMPWIFMFMLGTFASGLVLYWIANNTITFIQQYSIMRLQGYKPDVFGNIRASFQRNKKPDAK
ncbi:insertase [Actibacterium mucosum KCTC 23349]|uniref:Membrane protein insertase YidC n=1 Tax=Actibacterium mucosum KCTC 23349 TaxID=1454373 RepID=A0A037ZF77_9RHOB|nr:membrane protein insertase YidC [Actibacterium mucosum]KAJ54787.1 insertase [Actibacterium mucosum KCTC 23349]